MLPTDPQARKAIPIYSGFIKYFPLAIAAVAELSRKGNDQHNPGKPLHWDRSKSGDEMDALCRHMLDDALGVPVDTDNVLHATKLAWRAMANLQKLLEGKAADRVLGGEKISKAWFENRGTSEGQPKSFALVYVEYRNGQHGLGHEQHFDWSLSGSEHDIIKWRYANG